MPHQPWRAGPITVCACPCHGNPRIAHIAPCCQPCARCGQRFSAGLDEHERQCGAGSERPAG